MGRELGPEVYAAAGSGLVGYWRLNEGTGQLTFDLTDFASHGRLGESTASDPHDPSWAVSDAVIPSLVFRDGLESGGTSAWSLTVP